jgi:hypothetical protein
LIGRSIFIRYLEDRGVLVEKYFRRVAAGDKERSSFPTAASAGVRRAG